MSTAPKPRLVEKPDEAIEFASWDRISPGTYSAYSRNAFVYLDRGFKRWVCMVKFDILDGEKKIASLAWFLNLGKGEKAHAGLRSNFYAAWVMASGTKPQRLDRTALKVFKGRMATVTVDYITRNHKQQAIPDAAAYSVITQVLSWDTGSNNQLITQSTYPSFKQHGIQSDTGNPWQSGAERGAPSAAQAPKKKPESVNPEKVTSEKANEFWEQFKKEKKENSPAQAQREARSASVGQSHKSRKEFLERQAQELLARFAKEKPLEIPAASGLVLGGTGAVQTNFNPNGREA